MKEIIVTSSVLILCIILIRRLFKGKISSRLQYALWILVALRLVIPATAQIYMAVGDATEFRLMDLMESAEQRIGSLTEKLNEPIRYRFAADLSDIPQSAQIGNIVGGADGPTSVFLAGRIGFSWLDVFRWIWFGGIFVAAVWMFITNIVFYHRMKKSRKEFTLSKELTECLERKLPEKSMRRLEKIKKYTAKQLASPCLYGLPGREAVYLTEDVTKDADKLCHVLTHELCHKKHGDSFWSMLRVILVAVYWFHPLIWVAAALSKRDCELACDEAALALLGEEERISYGETLLSIITRKGTLSDFACTATTMTGSAGSVKERIRFIAKKPKVLGITAVSVIALVMLVLVFVFTKNPRFSGGILERDGLTVTAADMQVTLPESLVGIGGIASENGNDDLIIYQAASGQEAGRFCRTSFAEAVAFVDEGREVIPLGYYGLNNLLREYMHLPVIERTEHNYSTPEEESYSYTPTEKVPGTDSNNGMTELPDTDSSNGAAGFPGTDSSDGKTEPSGTDNNDAANSADEPAGSHEYLPNEDIIVSPDVQSENADEEDFSGKIPSPEDSDHYGLHLPYEEGQSMEPQQLAEEQAAKAEADSHADDELSVEYEDTTYFYLPNENITTTATPVSSNYCYLYVKADYTNVSDKYLEEMEYINSELVKVADSCFVLQSDGNNEIGEEMFEKLAENKTMYLGDNSAVGALIFALPVPEGLSYRYFELETGADGPNSLILNYDMTTENMADIDSHQVCFDAVMLFATIGNLDKCSFAIHDKEAVIAYEREEMEKVFPDRLQSQELEKEDFKKHIEALYPEVMEYLESISQK